jgi:hypothetical protein
MSIGWDYWARKARQQEGIHGASTHQSVQFF